MRVHTFFTLNQLLLQLPLQDVCFFADAENPGSAMEETSMEPICYCGSNAQAAVFAT